MNEAKKAELKTRRKLGLKKKYRWTEQKMAFVRYYTTPGPAKYNGPRAAIAAGYSEHSARAISSRLLSDAKVRKAIDKKLAKQMMSPDEVRDRLSVMGRGSLEPFTRTNKHGEVLIDLGSEEAKEHFGLVKKIKQTKKVTSTGRGEGKETTTEYRTEVEIHDSKDALDKIAKIQGQYTDKDNDGNPLQPTYKLYIGVDPDAV